MKPADTKPRGSGGYADLVIALASGGASELAAVADFLGYVPGHRRPPAETRRPWKKPPESEAPAPPVIVEGDPVDVPFWYLEKRTFLEPIPAPEISHDPAPEWAGLPDAPGRLTELAQWGALMPRMRTGFAEQAVGKALDIPAIIRRLERAGLLDRLPRRRRRRWGRDVHIVIDRSVRLTPFFRDQDIVADRIARLFPRANVRRVFAIQGYDKLYASGPSRGVGPHAIPEAGTLVLVLGDLGALALDRDQAMARWLTLGQRLARAGCRAAALMPCPPSLCPGSLARLWTIVPWDQRNRTAAVSQRDRAARANRLLRLCSPAVRLDLGLLRDNRLLLGVDASTEADVWQHADLIGRSSVAGTIQPGKAANDLRRELTREEPPAMRAAAIAHLLRWRGDLPREILFDEIMSLDDGTLLAIQEPIRTELRRAAERYLIEVEERESNDQETLAWYRRVYARASPWFHDQTNQRLKTAQHRLYAAAFRDVADPPPPPPDFDPRRLPAGQQVQRVTLFQAAGDVSVTAGSPLATVETSNDQIGIGGDPFWASGAPPLWADEWGTDAYGKWVSFGVTAPNGGHVIQRMRWIEPGRFQMGSPDDEEGRWDDEGPRHEVAIGEGFWLFDTPCTEALWRAVMGKPSSNPKGPDHPITNVSWDDAQEFIARLNAAKPDLALGLPSEARWEYAGRAGTTGATYAGPAIVADKDNAPMLNRIAWWAGNSESRTHPVGSKEPNAWGLLDMLGNVLEWCEDNWHGNYRGAPAEGSAWIDGRSAANRVLRGGSWFNDARDVRSAIRSGGDPAFRLDFIGFRCARVQAQSVASEAERRAGRSGRQQAERASRDDQPVAEPSGDLAIPAGADWLGGNGEAGGVLRLGIDERAVLPRNGVFLIRTDREELRLSRLFRPNWATEIGRDHHGLFTVFTVPDTEVSQRMRWIPPGRFWMGSPEDEPGRFDNEGPRHLVTLEHGFWLFDTPCTQALWQVVMGDNPSHFITPGRPVDTVSFDDARDFIGKLNGRLDGLDLTLPSEAEWEYACRAGTEDATYAGPMTILGENHAPVLDPIAWYGGNSGREFDLDNGFDVHSLREKQYDAPRAGTRIVGQKAANAWGLYDMLGNVWEWCADRYHRSYDGAPSNGLPRLDAGRQGAAARVLRGGSWINVARYVRSALRFDLDPAYRSDGIGFRCARVQRASGAIAKGGEEQASGAERAAAPTGPERTLGKRETPTPKARRT